MTITLTTAPSSSAQEAKETLAQTKAEASKGDQQAIRKLAKEQAAHPQEVQQPVNGVNTSKTGLNVQA